MVSEAPVISVVIPLFNAGRWVLETLESVRAQTFSRWEIVVVDDGSTDDGPALIRDEANRDGRIRFFQQANAGPAVARNYGAQQARGDWLIFLDADDLLPPERMEKDYQATQQSADVQVAVGSVEWFSADGGVAHQSLLTGDLELNRWRHQFHSVFNFAAMLVRRAAYFACGGFNPDRSVFYAEDYDYTLRLLEKAENVQAEGMSLRVRKHDTNRSTLAERTVIEHTLEVIRRTWSRYDVELTLAQADQLFRFWRQEPGVMTVSELQEVVHLQTVLAKAYVEKRPAGNKSVARAWEQTLAVRLAEANLPKDEESHLLRIESAERGLWNASRIRLRLGKLRWQR
ncbi:MAG: glycosyl transferase family 2 [Verrucomicrobia bacterium]|jgi:glycosyltransferase involved in cell wall biosynthesis|nr:glycosyl transferase family 2 [Verrucomicrobiota bacterium]